MLNTGNPVLTNDFQISYKGLDWLSGSVHLDFADNELTVVVLDKQFAASNTGLDAFEKKLNELIY